MSQMTPQKHNISEFNNGNEYGTQGVVAEDFTNLVENTTYANETIESLDGGIYSSLVSYKFPSIVNDSNGASYMAIYKVNGEYQSFSNITPPNATYWKSLGSTSPEYTMAVASTTTGYAKSYELLKDNVATGVKIDIPKDMVISSAEIKTVTQNDIPYQGAVIGDKYIDFTIANATSDHLYLPVNDLGNGLVNIGTVETETLAEGLDAEVDIETVFNAEDNKYYTNFQFHIPKGDTGEQGIQGIQGETGNGITTIAKTGTSGLVDTYTIAFNDSTSTTFTVTNGEKGDKGNTGLTPDLQIGNTTTLETGQPATATISGTTDNPILNLGLPKGNTGSQGIQGKSYFPKGEWSSETAYVNNSTTIDTVFYLGSTYYCKQSNTNQTPTNTTYWEILAEKGSDTGVTIVQTTGESETAIMSQKAVSDELNLKVDKVTGKQLSTEDFTSTEKTKLAGLNNYDDTQVQADLSILNRYKADYNNANQSILAGTVSAATGDFENINDNFADVYTELFNKADKNNSNQSIVASTVTAAAGYFVNINGYLSTKLKIDSFVSHGENANNAYYEMNTLRIKDNNNMVGSYSNSGIQIVWGRSYAGGGTGRTVTFDYPFADSTYGVSCNMARNSKTTNGWNYIDANTTKTTTAVRFICGGDQAYFICIGRYTT